MPLIEPLDHRNVDVARDIHRVSQLAYKVEAELLGIVTFPPLSETSENILESEHHFFGIVADEQLVGVVALETEAEGVLIARLVVAPLYTRRGFATSMLNHVLKRFRGDLRVVTATANHPAVVLYQKLGFTIESTKLAEEGIELVTFFA